MKVTIQRFDCWSIAKISALLYAVFGLIEGLIFSLISIFTPNMGFLFGTLAIITFPIFGALMGLVMGAFSGWLYNVTASLVGGVSFETK